MPQLSLYLDDETMETLRTDSERSGLSMSKYAAKLIREHAGGPEWPRGYWERVYGSITDPTFMIDDSDLDPSLDDDPALFFA